MKKLIIRLLLALLLLIISIVAFSIWNLSKQYKKLSKGELITQLEVDTIPFSYSSSGHILIQASINGSQSKYPFILDCGASNIIFKNSNTDFNLKSNGFGIGIGASGNVFTSKIKEIDSLQIGKIKFRYLNAKEISFNTDCPDEAYGLIGTGIMHHLDWQFDFENELVFVSPTSENFQINDTAIFIPLSLNKHSNHLKTPIKFRANKKLHWVLIDTGNSGALQLKEKRIVNDSLNFQVKNYFGINSNGLGKEKQKDRGDKIYLADSLIFHKNGYGLTNFPIHTSPKGIDILGLGFFKKYKTTISWKSKALILEAYTNTPKLIWETFGFSMKYDKESGETRISGLTENTPAFDKQVPINARVISINDFKFDNKDALCNYKMLNKLYEKITLTVRNNGQIERYNLTRIPIFE